MQSNGEKKTRSPSKKTTLSKLNLNDSSKTNSFEKYKKSENFEKLKDSITQYFTAICDFIETPEKFEEGDIPMKLDESTDFSIIGRKLFFGGNNDEIEGLSKNITDIINESSFWISLFNQIKENFSKTTCNYIDFEYTQTNIKEKINPLFLDLLSDSLELLKKRPDLFDISDEESTINFLNNGINHKITASTRDQLSKAIDDGNKKKKKKKKKKKEKQRYEICKTERTYKQYSSHNNFSDIQYNEIEKFFYQTFPYIKIKTLDEDKIKKKIYTELKDHLNLKHAYDSLYASEYKSISEFLALSKILNSKKYTDEFYLNTIQSILQIRESFLRLEADAKAKAIIKKKGNENIPSSRRRKKENKPIVRSTSFKLPADSPFSSLDISPKKTNEDESSSCLSLDQNLNTRQNS